MTLSFRELGPHEFSSLAPELVEIYITAMNYPRSIKGQRVAVWRNEIFLPGFTAVAAVDTADAKQSRLAGVAYGFLGTPDRWWDQQLRRGLTENQLMTPSMLQVLRNYFEVAEIHLLPGFQGHGTGNKLIRFLLERTSARYALLSTPEVAGENNAAFGLYRSLGFNDILRQFYYAGDPRPFAVLGRTLPLENSVE